MTCNTPNEVTNQIWDRPEIEWQNSRLLVGWRQKDAPNTWKELWVEIFEVSPSRLETRFYHAPFEDRANWDKTKGWKELKTIHPGVADEGELVDLGDRIIDDKQVQTIEVIYKILWNHECGNFGNFDDVAAIMDSLEHRKVPPEVRLTRTRYDGKRPTGKIPDGKRSREEDDEAEPEPQPASKRAKTGGNRKAPATPKKNRKQTAKHPHRRPRQRAEDQFFSRCSDDEELPLKTESSERGAYEASGPIIPPGTFPQVIDLTGEESPEQADDRACEQADDLPSERADDISPKQADNLPSDQDDDNRLKQAGDRPPPGNDGDDSATSPALSSVVPEDFLDPYFQCTNEDFGLVVNAVENTLGSSFMPPIHVLDEMKREFRGNQNLESPWDTNAWRDWSADRSSRLMKGVIGNYGDN
ncbi:MAG: hypothetical protein M1831_000005 [Alyxoria varia]|nr:MAG: hypothetical protein M1831_000005 [Alyxoria varia]